MEEITIPRQLTDDTEKAKSYRASSWQLMSDSAGQEAKRPRAQPSQKATRSSEDYKALERFYF